MSSSFTNLHLTNHTIQQLISQHFGITGSISQLLGEVDFNYKLNTKNDHQYTIKISRPEVDVAELDFQAKLMQHLNSKDLPFQVPQMIPTLEGKTLATFKDAQNSTRFIRLQTWVEGRMLAEANPRSSKLLHNWGATCGHLCNALADFDHPKAHRSYKWNPSEFLETRILEQYLKDSEEQAITTYFWQLFEEETAPKLTTLRKSVNYNDAHEHNLLVSDQLENPQVAGVIDFGDAIYTHTINELAIACAYASMYLPEPLEAVKQVVKGFHEVFPLEATEVEVLYSLIAARLVTSVVHSAQNKVLEPENDYLLISEKPAWDALKKWRTISKSLAHYTFRDACGWEACPKQYQFQQWLKNSNPVFSPVVKADSQKVITLDLSVGSLDLGNNSNFDTITEFHKTISRHLEDHEATIGIGGYGEIRPIYTTDAFQKIGNEGSKWRTVHLGLDYWTKANTPVYAPFDGIVYSVADNAGDGDYGPTIILEHRISETFRFYTLYGHLSKTSLALVSKAGMPVKKGEQIAWIGPPPENGNWSPHLHFQIILDMLDEQQDFPGVAYPDSASVWLSICPNPHLLFPDLHLPKSTDIEDRIAAILASRKTHLGRSLSISYQKPLHMVRGYQQYLYDSTARRYLDTVNNVAHVGHEHPSVVRAAQRQIGLLNTNTRYLHENIVEFAEALVDTMPPALSVVHFVNSGSEANELALRMAQTITHQKDNIAIEVGYHGNTNATIEVSSYKFDGKGGKGAPPYTHIVPIPDTYRGLYRNKVTAGQQYAEHVQSMIQAVQAKGRNVASFIAESILSCGGQIVLPKGYLKAVYEYVRAAGGLCIADEVQVGFGRVGEHFWGFELQDVVPDIVTMGKPIGNGHPLGAVVTTEAVATAFANGMEYFNTFGGNPVSCAIGKEVLKVVHEEGLQQNALAVGTYLKGELHHLQQSYPIIGDVRGHGLFLGFELVKDDQLTPAAKEASYLANRMRERGILMSTDGPHYNVLKIKPPICFNRQNVDFLIENLNLVFQEDFLTLDAF